MVLAYWLIEREIVEEIQRGKKRAEYGKQLIENLSQRLTERCGQGFLVINLQWFRKFYLVYRERITIPYPTGMESYPSGAPRQRGAVLTVSPQEIPACK
jgi:hypothetical protein